MVVDVLVIALVVGAVWWWRNGPRQARHARDGGEPVPLLPYEDLPPIGAFDPLPAETQLDAYVETGLAQLDGYLTGRDTNA
ncbi:MAG TPA: hypothetical protein VI248_08055 [Kineosporiaceae bacterium]